MLKFPLARTASKRNRFVFSAQGACGKGGPIFLTPSDFQRPFSRSIVRHALSSSHHDVGSRLRSCARLRFSRRALRPGAGTRGLSPRGDRRWAAYALTFCRSGTRAPALRNRGDAPDVRGGVALLGAGPHEREGDRHSGSGRADGARDASRGCRGALVLGLELGGGDRLRALALLRVDGGAHQGARSARTAHQSGRAHRHGVARRRRHRDRPHPRAASAALWTSRGREAKRRAATS